jgi:hypothetical protein
MSIVARSVLALISVMGSEQLWTLSWVQDTIPNGLTQPPSKGIFSLNLFNFNFLLGQWCTKEFLEWCSTQVVIWKDNVLLTKDARSPKCVLSIDPECKPTLSMLQRVTVLGVHTHLLWSCLWETCVGCTVTYIAVIIPVQLVSLYIMLSTTKLWTSSGRRNSPVLLAFIVGNDLEAVTETDKVKL